MKILLIEDELLIQKSLKKLMEKKGATVYTESTGKKAIEALRNQYFDRIICDLMLQDITGFDVIESSKELYSHSEIEQKFIIITAYSSPQVLDKASQYGCLVLGKPFSDIDRVIKIFLSGKN